MRYIKKFEDNNMFNIGDIIFYKTDNETFKDYFDNNPGEIVDYDFTERDDFYVVYFYNLPKQVDFTKDKRLYIRMNVNNRKATTEETKEYNIKKEANKYNL